MKIKNILFLAAVGVGALASCSDDTTPVLELRNAATLNAITPAEYTINKDNAGENFPAISWEKADYGKGAIVEYTVTVKNENSGESVSLDKTYENNLSFTNAKMNDILGKIGAHPGEAANYTVSLKSETNGVYSNDASNTVTFRATTYDPRVDNVTWKYAYVAEGYDNGKWDINKSFIVGDPDGTGEYRGYGEFDSDCTFAIIDGNNMANVLSEGNEAGKGFREVTFNEDGDMSVSDDTKWGIVGDATSGGWTKDTDLEYDAATGKWSCVTSLVGGKKFKFRANAAWNIDFGSDGTENGLSHGGADIPVEKDHGYIVTLDLTNAGKYTYSLEETNIVQSSAYITLPGSYQSDPWKENGDDVYKLTSQARDFKFSGAYYFPAGTTFKFWDNGTWIGYTGDLNWSEDGSSVKFTIGDGKDISVPKAGYYNIYADLQKNIATMTKTGWEVVGSACAGGWDKGDVLDYDPATDTWSGIVTLADGEIKFRWNGAWDYNFGGSITALKPGGDNIAVTAGKYKFTLKVNADKSAATATMEEVK